MKRKFNYLLTFFISIGICFLLTSIVIAKDLDWFDKALPSDKVTAPEKVILEDKHITQWQSNSYWKEGNCYYYDLYIGNATNTTWADNRRELSCGKILTSDQIETLQLEQISWTMSQLAKDPVVTEPTKTLALKGEDFKDGKVIKG